MNPLPFLVFAATAAFAAPPAKMAVWQTQNHAELARLDTPAAKAALLGNRAALTNLFAQVKPAGLIDPVVAVRFNALTQYAASPSVKESARKAYAEALLEAAKAARDADTQSMFFEQLRWCAFPQQKDSILASALPGAAGMAALAADSATGAGVGMTSLALSPEETGDPAVARKALEEAKDDEARIRALDLLGRAGDPSSADFAARYVSHPNAEVCEAALMALEAFSPAAVASRVPAFLAAATPANERVLLDALRRLPTVKLGKALCASFASFSPTGKKIALELMGQRRIQDGIQNALAALAETNVWVQIGGYRMLRDTAGTKEAPAVAARTLALPDGRVREEAVAALAGIAKRDGGVVESALDAAIQTGGEASRETALAAAPRIGGERLLRTVVKVAEGTGGTAEDATRALAAWMDEAACPALLRLAASSQSLKCRKLAVMGLRKKVTEENKERLLGVWLQERAKMPDGEAKKGIDELFGDERNVAKRKPVSTNVRHEGNRVAANLTDGTPAPWFGHGLPAVATVDIGEVLPVHAAKILFWYSDPRTYTFALELSEDGKTWKKVGGNETDPKPATADGVNVVFEETPARFVRLTVLGNTANPNAHVHELEVYQRLF